MSKPELAEEVLRWVHFAAEDLAAGQALLEEGHPFPRHACWLAQQAAEKSLKAALVSEEITFPFRHDLDALRNLLPEGWQVKEAHSDLAELTEWAVEARYPGDWPEPTGEDAQRAMQQARGVCDSIRADLAKRNLIT